LTKWIQPRRVGYDAAGIDGVRIDAYEQLPPRFVQELREGIKTLKSDALMIVEDWTRTADAVQ
jgi:glycosidase